MNRRSFIKRTGVMCAILWFAPKANAEWGGIGPAYAGVNPKHTYGGTEPFLIGVPLDWEYAYVIDLSTGKQLQYGGRDAEVTECSARYGWAMIQDHYTPEGQDYLDTHDELLKVRVRGRFAISRTPDA